jgi:hypothetical protein
MFMLFKDINDYQKNLRLRKKFATLPALLHCGHLAYEAEHRLHFAGGEDGREEGADMLPVVAAQVGQLVHPELQKVKCGHASSHR